MFSDQVICTAGLIKQCTWLFAIFAFDQITWDLCTMHNHTQRHNNIERDKNKLVLYQLIIPKLNNKLAHVNVHKLL